MSSLPAIIEKPKSVEQWHNDKTYCTPGSAIIFDVVAKGRVSQLQNGNWPITGLHFCLRHNNSYYDILVALKHKEIKQILTCGLSFSLSSMIPYSWHTSTASDPEAYGLFRNLLSTEKSYNVRLIF